jgi:protease II
LKSALRPLRVSIWLLLPVFGQSPSVPKAPDTPKRVVTDAYQGVTVTDDYRWLENWDDPETKQWSRDENERTREYLDHLPMRAAIQERLRRLISDSSPGYYGLSFAPACCLR